MDVVARLHEEIAGRQELDALAEEIATFVARIDQHEHELLTRLREFDARQGWVGQATSCPRWLSWRTGLSMQAARERVRVARALGRLPRIDEAMKRGELSYTKVRALTRVATPQTEQVWIETARRRPADHLEFMCREGGHHTGRTALPKRIDRRFVRRRNTPQGMVRIEIQLPPAEAEVVWDAIAAATERDAAQPTASVPDAKEEETSEPASAEASSASAPLHPQGPQVRASAEAMPDAVRFAEARRRCEEEAFRVVRAQLEAAERTRARRSSRSQVPANDSPDLENVRATAVVALAKSYMRVDGEHRSAGRPRPP